MNKAIFGLLFVHAFFAYANEHTLSIEKSLHVENGIKKMEISFDSAKFFDIKPDLSLYLSNKASHDFVGHYSNSMTVGFREKSMGTTSGINVSWDIFNPASFPIFQASMGYEFGFSNWNFFYNGYFPLRLNFTKKDADYVFSNRSEVGFVTKCGKWELLFAPIYYHDTSEFGASIGISYLINSGLDFNFKPYFDSTGKHNIIFSVSLNMGNNDNALHRKTNRPQTRHFKTKKRTSKKTIRNHIVQQISEPVNIPTPVLPPSSSSLPPPPEEVSWWDFFFQIIQD